MDAITLLRNDHRTVLQVFKRYDQAGARAHKTKKGLLDKISRELSIHAAVEEQVFYPAVRHAAPGAAELVLESLEEHLVVKWELSALERMDPRDERFDAKARVLMEMVRQHIEEEEGELFPEVRAALSRAETRALGEELEAAKRMAPTRPHPMAPDTPPANLVTGPAAAVIDKARDAGHDAVEALREKVS